MNLLPCWRAACVCAFSLVLLATPLRAQEAPPPPDWPTAAPADVASIDAIMVAVYDVISGPKGEERNWDRFRSLFHPAARLIPVRVPQDGTTPTPAYMGLDEYIEQAGPFFVERGFFETETHRVTEQYGHIAHVFSTYDSRWNPDDEAPFSRGINSFQLMHDGSRWWVVNIFWDSERPGQPIPEAYLPGGE